MSAHIEVREILIATDAQPLSIRVVLQQGRDLHRIDAYLHDVGCAQRHVHTKGYATTGAVVILIAIPAVDKERSGRILGAYPFQDIDQP
jgi:hypothetical protein